MMFHKANNLGVTLSPSSFLKHSNLSRIEELENHLRKYRQIYRNDFYKKEKKWLHKIKRIQLR